MSPSISCRRVGSTDGGRLYPPVIGFQVRSWEGVVELKTSCRHWQSESQDSALNLDPLDRTRFSRQDIPDLASCSLSCWIHHCSWAKRSCRRRGETTAKY